MRRLCLLIAFVLMWSLNAWAQESSVVELSGLAVEISSPDVTPFKVFLYKNRKSETGWDGDIPRTPAQPIDDNHKGLNIPMRVMQEGEVVSLELRVRLESLKEVTLATYCLRLNESVSVDEVVQYGFKPFVIKIVRINVQPSFVIPPLNEFPKVENLLQSVEIIGLEKGDSADQYLLSLRNTSTRTVTDLEISMPTGGIVHERGSRGKPLIPAGATYQIDISAQTQGRKTKDGFEPDPIQPKGVINAALFDDGNYEGDFVSAATMEARRRGRQLIQRRIIALLEKVLSLDGITLQSVEELVYSLDAKGDAATIAQITRHYPSLDDRLQYVEEGVKDSLVAGKYDLIGKFKEYQERKPASVDDLHAWLKSTKEYFESLLDED